MNRHPDGVDAGCALGLLAEAEARAERAEDAAIEARAVARLAERKLAEILHALREGDAVWDVLDQFDTP